MEKIKVNGKEINIDENELKPLSDEELESATGGLILRDGYIVVYRRVCLECGAKSPYCTPEDRFTSEAPEINHIKPCSQSSFVEELRAFYAGY